jgi:hypothetical protein
MFTTYRNASPATRRCVSVFVPEQFLTEILAKIILPEGPFSPLPHGPESSILRCIQRSPVMLIDGQELGQGNCQSKH